MQGASFVVVLAAVVSTETPAPPRRRRPPPPVRKTGGSSVGIDRAFLQRMAYKRKPAPLSVLRQQFQQMEAANTLPPSRLTT